MNYLSRPVFDWPLQWVGPAQTVKYDLKPLNAGFGAAEFAPTASAVARGWRVKFWLKSALEIVAYEDWSAALKGRLRGFWFPEPPVVGIVIGTHSSGVINVRACGLAEVWDGETPLHVWLVDLAGNGTAAAVTAVTTPSAGVERVTIDAGLSPAAGWRMHRLLYVQQATDIESCTAMAEHWEERELSVVELPQEYISAETGEEPVWRYRFFTRPPGEAERSWYYTSLAESITIGGDEYVPLAISHGGITRSVDAHEEVVSIDTVLKAGTPWSEMLVDAPEHPLWVEIAKTAYATPTSGGVVFTGEMRPPKVEGRKVSMEFASWLDGAGRVPQLLFAAGCPHMLFDSRTCKVSAAAHELSLSLVSVSGDYAVLTGAGLVTQPLDYFARGVIHRQTGGNWEVRMILSSSAVALSTCSVRLSRPFRYAAPSDAVKIWPGCRGTRGDCETKFSNLPNYGGFDWMPRDNPVLKGPEVDGTGGKK